MPFIGADGLLSLTRSEDVIARTRAFAASGPVLCNGVAALQGEVVFLEGEGVGTTPPRFCGSDEATTCCIVYLRVPDGSRAACAHLDCEEAVAPFLEACEATGFWAAASGSGSGGGPPIGVAADAPRRPPLHAGAALDVVTGELRPARFVSFGPDEVARRSRCFVQGGEGCRVAYKGGAWAPVPLPGGTSQGSDALKWGMRRSALAMLAAMDDKKLLKVTSTSPEAEADGYVERMRDILRFIEQRMEAI